MTASLMLRGSKILIAKRKRGDHVGDRWEFPGGKIEDGETPEECLRREMEEEFKIDVSVGDFFCERDYTYEHGSFKILAY